MLQGHREATRSPKGVSESIALCLDFCSGFGGAKLCTLPVHFRGPLGAPLGPHPAPFLLDGWGEPKHASHILQKRWHATDLPGASQRSESCSRAGVHRNLLGALGGLRAAAGLVCTPTCLGLWKLGACLKLQGPARKANQQGLRKLQGASGNLGRPQRKSHLSTCCVLWMLKIKNFPRFARCCKRVYDLIKCKRTSPKNAAKNKNPNFDLRAGPEGTSCPQGQYQKTKNFPNLCT